jgi:hypothetical protein
MASVYAPTFTLGSSINEGLEFAAMTLENRNGIVVPKGADGHGQALSALRGCQGEMAKPRLGTRRLKAFGRRGASGKRLASASPCSSA